MKGAVPFSGIILEQGFQLMGKAVTYLTVLMVMIQMPVLLSAAEKSAVVAELAAGEERLTDTDKDGMPDEVELRFGMDVKNPSDALSDPDGDGFASLYEIEHGFDPSDPLSHPPLWWRLRVQKIVRVSFPVKFVSLKTGGFADKKRWLIGIEIADTLAGEKAVKKEVQLGDMLTIRKKRFRVKDVEKNGNSAVMVLQPVVSAAKQSADLKLTVGEAVYDWCPVVLDTGDPKRREYVLLPEQSIVLGVFTAYGKDGKELISRFRYVP